MMKMKYIGNAFAIGMIDSGIVKVDKITKSDFVEAGKTAYSIVGHPEIAENFGLKLNRESITLKTGDILYVVSPSQRPMAGKMVENGAKYEYIPESQGYVYKKVTIM